MKQLLIDASLRRAHFCLLEVPDSQSLKVEGSWLEARETDPAEETGRGLHGSYQESCRRSYQASFLEQTSSKPHFQAEASPSLLPKPAGLGNACPIRFSSWESSGGDCSYFHEEGRLSHNFFCERALYLYDQWEKKEFKGKRVLEREGGSKAESLRSFGDDDFTIYVGMGPGSFTGVRVAWSFAQALAITKFAKIYTFPSLLLQFPAQKLARVKGVFQPSSQHPPSDKSRRAVLRDLARCSCLSIVDARSQGAFVLGINEGDGPNLGGQCVEESYLLHLLSQNEIVDLWSLSDSTWFVDDPGRLYDKLKLLNIAPNTLSTRIVAAPDIMANPGATASEVMRLSRPVFDPDRNPHSVSGSVSSEVGARASRSAAASQYLKMLSQATAQIEPYYLCGTYKTLEK